MTADPEAALRDEPSGAARSAWRAGLLLAAGVVVAQFAAAQSPTTAPSVAALGVAVSAGAVPAGAPAPAGAAVPAGAAPAGAPAPAGAAAPAGVAVSAGAAPAAGAVPAGVTVPAGVPAGVADAQRAWQNWTLNCQGCHRPDGSGSAATAPPLAGTVSKFLNVPGGREYLGRVPGVATSPLPDAALAELMNWMFWRFDPEHLPADFLPFTAAEIGRLRSRPLRLEASQMRTAILAQADNATP